MQGMSHEDLLVEEEIFRAHVLICRARGLTAEASVRVLAEQATSTGVSLHLAALDVLGQSATGQESAGHPLGPGS